VLPTDRTRGPFRRLLIYFGLAENPDASVPGRGSSPPPVTKEKSAGGKGHSALAYFGLVEGPADSRYGLNVKPELDDDVDALRARIAELEARLAALEDRR
jgi:hypothetical protein